MWLPVLGHVWGVCMMCFLDRQRSRRQLSSNSATVYKHEGRAIPLHSMHVPFALSAWVTRTNSLDDYAARATLNRIVPGLQMHAYKRGSYMRFYDPERLAA